MSYTSQELFKATYFEQLTAIKLTESTIRPEHIKETELKNALLGTDRRP